MTAKSVTKTSDNSSSYMFHWLHSALSNVMTAKS